MPTPTTPPERYSDLADLAGGDDAAALARFVGHLDQALRPRSAPVQIHAALDQLLRQRLAAAMPPVPAEPLASATLSRRTALKAGAASMAWLLTLGHVSPAMAHELTRFAQEGPMTSGRLVGILQAERSRWNALLAQVGMDQMEMPGVEGTWSVKELVAHLTWYERVVVEGAQQVLGTGTYTRARNGLAGLGMDERNAHIAAESRSRPVGDVLAEAEHVFTQLLAVIAACPEDILNDPQRLGLPNEMVPWMAVANNSYAHYRQHEQAVRAWLDRSNRTTREDL